MSSCTDGWVIWLGGRRGSRETILDTGKAHLWRWRKWLFAVLARNAQTATSYFGLPANRVVELGMQVEI